MELLDELTLIKRLYSLVEINDKAREQLWNESHTPTLDMPKSDEDDRVIMAYEQERKDLIAKHDKFLEDLPRENEFIEWEYKHDELVSKWNAIWPPLLIFAILSVFSVPLLIVSVISGNVVAAIIFASLIAVSVIVSIFWGVRRFKKRKHAKKKPLKKDNVDEFNESLLAIDKRIADRKREIDAGRKEAEKIKANRGTLLKRLSESKKNLAIAKEALAEAIHCSRLHEHYSSFPCVCQFILYLETGRCSELGGPNGCYNVYEMELRLGLIIDNLESIKQSVWHIEKNIEEIRRSMPVIVHELELINKSSLALGRALMNVSKTQKSNQKALENISKNTRLIRLCQGFLAAEKTPAPLRIQATFDAFRNEDFIDY